VDRNFCTRGLLNGIAGRDGYFVIRQHGNLPIEILTPQRQLGTTATGKLHEQTVQLTTQDGVVLSLRRSIRVQLKSATRGGDRNIYILTKLPKRVFAKKVAELYRNRWTIETAFKDLTVHLRCEINTLRYPPAALLGFCVALIAYITLAVWRSR
jgi:IS4 transposase